MLLPRMPHHAAAVERAPRRGSPRVALLPAAHCALFASFVVGEEYTLEQMQVHMQFVKTAERLLDKQLDSMSLSADRCGIFSMHACIRCRAAHRGLPASSVRA